MKSIPSHAIGPLAGRHFSADCGLRTSSFVRTGLRVSFSASRVREQVATRYTPPPHHQHPYSSLLTLPWHLQLHLHLHYLSLHRRSSFDTFLTFVHHSSVDILTFVCVCVWSVCPRQRETPFLSAAVARSRSLDCPTTTPDLPAETQRTTTHSHIN